MTSIDWLQVSGIRSFNPNKQSAIKFNKPLTIILGGNGCGKTTIIECLKAATTGELPPNSNRGKSFIHDPKILGDTEVKGQIRLQFRSSNQKQMVVVRSYQLTQKEKKAEFKQLEAAIHTRGADGKITSNSHRCSEIDKLIPSLMGVSKAVLENVILTHQEDVNWPLSDSATLKKKFDDIFATTRYTKALDAINKSKKEQASLLKDYKGELAVIAAHQEHAHKLRVEAESEKAKIQDLKNRIEEIENQTVEYDRHIERFDKKMEEIRTLNNSIRETKTRIEERTNEVSSIYNKLEHEFTETDEEVTRYKNDYMSQLEKLTEERDATQGEVLRLESEKDQCNEELRSLSSSLGGLRSQKQNHEARVSELSSRIGTLAQQYNLTAFLNRQSFSDRDALAFVTELETGLKSLNEQMTVLKGKNRMDDVHEGEGIVALQGKISTLQSNIRRNEQKMTMARSQRLSLQQQIQTQGANEETLQSLQQEVSKLEADFQEKKSALNVDADQGRIEQIRSQITQLKHKIMEIEREMKDREAEKLVHMRVTDLQTELTKAENELKMKFEQMLDNLAQLLGVATDVLTVENADEQLKASKRAKRDQMDNHSRKVRQTEQSQSSLKGRIDLYEGEIRKLKDQLKSKEVRLREAIPDGRQYSDLLTEAETNVEHLRTDVSMAESLIKCYQNFVRLAEDHKECPVCERGLDHSELTNFVSLQQDKLNQAPQHLERKKHRLVEMEQVLSKLRDLSPLLQEIERIKMKDIPDLEKKRTLLEEEWHHESNSLEGQRAELKKMKEEEDRVMEMQQQTEDMNRMRDAVKRLQFQLTQEEQKLKQLSTRGASSQSIDSLSEQHQQMQQDLEKLNKQLDTARDELQNKRTDISNMTTALSTKKEQVQKQQLLLEQGKRLREQEEKLVADLQDMEKEIKEYQAEIPGIETQMLNLKENQQQNRQTRQNQESALNEQINQWQRDVNNVQVLSNEISNYIDRDMEGELQNAEQRLQKHEIKIKGIVSEIQVKSEAVKNKSELIDKQDLIKRNIEDNLEHRIKKRDLDALISQRTALEEQLRDVTGGETIDETDINNKRTQRQQLDNEKSRYLGMRVTHKKQLDKLSKDQQDGKYKDVDLRHRAALIKVKSTEMAIADMGKYHKALDKALMSFHTSKMAEINEVVKELWQKVYRGQDIDTIEIRSEAEDSASPTRRSYNYRVVMIKGDVALDMRGRCSAGQKVLACLIIRLALSEAFCIDCGLLTLDEPTVNLDADNVHSLAEALQVIVTERKTQSNFQLVVITHDEEFVNRLGRGYVENYYRVSKDPLDQSSTITKQAFID